MTLPLSRVKRHHGEYGDSLAIRVFRDLSYTDDAYLGYSDLFVILWGHPVDHPLLVKVLSPRLGMVYMSVGLADVDTEVVP